MSDLKVEILLPLRYNEDRNGKRKKIEGEKYSQTFDELVVRFGGCTIDNSPLLGGWLDPTTQKQIRDENSTYWVVCKNNSRNIQFFHELKRKLKTRFKQKDMMIYYITINRF